MEISLLTITCNRDTELLKRQQKSIEQYLAPGYKHYIIFNDDYDLMSEIPGAIHKHSIKGYEDSKWGGWHTQQALKLLSAAVIETEHYLVLDSKNFLTTEFDPAVLIDTAKYEMVGWDCNFAKFLINSYEVFGLNAREYSPNIMWSRTPFVMHRQTVLDMLKYLEDHNISLTELLDCGDKQCTEFYLYSAWVSKTQSRNIHWVHGYAEIDF